MIQSGFNKQKIFRYLGAVVDEKVEKDRGADKRIQAGTEVVRKAKNKIQGNVSQEEEILMITKTFQILK